MNAPAKEAGYLGLYLSPFLSQLARGDVTDIYVNRPGEIWVETLGGSLAREVVPELTEELLWRLARQVASATHQGVSREEPLLAATLPDGSRVQIVAPPATRGPMAVAIRKHVVADMSLDDYAQRGSFTATKGEAVADAADATMRRQFADRHWAEFLRSAVKARKTILVSGGTSTGKTTLLNALIREISPDERLVFIEDTPELIIRHRNALGLLAVRGRTGEANVTAEDLLTASLRVRPDRIILGELRGSEAFTFLRAVNSGHPGSLTTIHADSPDRAVEQLALLVVQSTTNLRREDVVRYVTNAVDVFVQLGRFAGMRQVTQVSWPKGNIRP